MAAIRVRRVAAPATDIVILAEAKAQCRVDHADDDTLLTRLCKLASGVVQDRAGKSLVTQDWALYLHSATGCVDVPRGVFPVQSIVSIAYTDPNGDAQTASAADFEIVGDEDGAVIKPKSGKWWPVTSGQDGALVITLRSGFGAMADIPENLRHAALMLISHWYENRSSVDASMSAIPDAANELIGLSRSGWVL